VTPPAGPDPRIERSRRAILQATLDELGEVGYGAMSIESIAARAGVGKATVYRHWRGKLDLLESALHTVKQDIEIPAEGSVRERITAFLHALASFLANSELSACMPALVSASQYDESVREFQTRFNRSRRQQLVDLVAQGIASGELDGHLDPVFAAEMLASPLFYRRLLSSEPYPPDDVERIVDVVLP
jgi:TetR/AcrR family transcriptional regulator of autoinduction and epiphytic fitness